MNVFQFTADQFTEDKPHEFSAEASQLRIAPGIVPDKFTVQGLGNGLDFLLVSILGAEGQAWRYRQVSGCVTITIFND